MPLLLSGGYQVCALVCLLHLLRVENNAVFTNHLAAHLCHEHTPGPCYTACRVLYSSATGASEPSNLAYMARLLPTGFKDTMDMVKTLKTAGLGSLELFCMGLKATGSYLARTLSYHGAKFELQDIQLSMEMRWGWCCQFIATVPSTCRAEFKQPSQGSWAAAVGQGSQLVSGTRSVCK